MSDDLEEIDGIGPTYADRLRNAGIGSVEELSDSDPSEVSEAAEAPESKAESWVGKAAEFVGGESTEGTEDGSADEEKNAGPSEDDGEEEAEGEEESEEGEDGADDEEADGGDSSEEEEDEDKTTKEKLSELGFYDNDFTEFPPELSGLKRFKAEKNPEPIIEALRIVGYDTTFMRLEMVEALGRIGDEAAVDVLVDEVNNKDTRSEAMDALGRIGSEDATDKILELLDPERKVQPHVRAKAAETAGRIGDEAAVDDLVANLDSDSERVRSAITEALGEIGSPDTVEPLAELLAEEKEESVRIGAARALRSIGTEDAEDVLAEYEDDRNELVAQAASAV